MCHVIRFTAIVCNYDSLLHCFLLSFCGAYFQEQFTIFLLQHFSENKNHTNCNDLKSKHPLRIENY